MKRLLTASVLLLASLLPRAEQPFDPMEATLEQNINHPAVAPRHSAAVAAGMTALARSLQNAGYDVSTERNAEVVVVTIAASDLFASNATTLAGGASALLTPLWHYIQMTDRYKVLVASHTDDTGDELYSDRLSSDRANAVDEFFYRLAGTDTGIIPYGIGREDPVASNVTIDGRRKNRRIEIFFIPTAAHIDNLRRSTR